MSVSLIILWWHDGAAGATGTGLCAGTHRLNGSANSCEARLTRLLRRKIRPVFRGACPGKHFDHSAPPRTYIMSSDLDRLEESSLCHL